MDAGIWRGDRAKLVSPNASGAHPLTTAHRLATRSLAGHRNAPSPMKTSLQASILFDFESDSQVTEWKPLNDTVMGGCSTSRLHYSRPGHAAFIGVTSLENRGGFASVLAEIDSRPMADTGGIAVRVRGDGRAYRLLVSEDDRPGRGCYDIEFETTPGVWLTIGLPFAEMRFNMRGRRPRQNPPVATNVQSIGLLIGDNCSGAFALEIDWIAAYR